MKKIIYFYPSMVDRAGTERVWTDKMNNLAEHSGYDIILLTYEQCGRPLVYSLSSKVKHIDLGVPFIELYRYNRLNRLLQEWLLMRELQQRFNEIMEYYRPDILVASTYFAKILSVVVNCPVRTIRIMESHIDKRFFFGSGFKRHQSLPNRLRFRIEKWQAERCARHFDLLVSLTREDAKEWSPYVKTMVIPNVVHLREDGKHSECNAKNVIFAGRLEPQKGIPDLFRIWMLVHQQHPDWHLDIYGDGSMENELKTEANKLNVNIHLYPADHHIMDRYCEHSIFVLSSIFEPFGLVIVEAMSCGLPVVVFDCPYGPHSILTDGKEGFLVADRDVEAFADCVCRLIENDELRMQMGREGMKTSRLYSAERIMPQWVSLFKGLANALDEVR